MSKLHDEIGGLSRQEKFDLLDVLWESLEADPVALSDEQEAELDDRVKQYERNPSEVVPWEQVKARLFENL